MIGKRKLWNAEGNSELTRNSRSYFSEFLLASTGIGKEEKVASPFGQQAVMALTHQETDVPVSTIPAVNVATVPQRSPLRYPGGKTWLVPHIRVWLATRTTPSPILIEPFAGGGIVSLTAVMENLTEQALMVELDADVAAFWQAALSNATELIDRVRAFDPTRDGIQALTRSAPTDTVERGFRTLVLNRVRRGGILAPGASLSRVGENGKGLRSRWYPETLAKRLEAIGTHAYRIEFKTDDGMSVLREMDSDTLRDAALFVDPPYTAAGKKAGSRLYAHHSLDHAALFEFLAECDADFLMTYDYNDETLDLARRHDFHVVQVSMKNTHHARISELVITRRRIFERV